MRLKDKVAIVTGGAHGIGEAICLHLASERAKVAVADIDEKGAMATAKDIEAKDGDALALKTDVCDPESTQEMARKTAEHFGRIDILVNNAAIFFRPSLTEGPFWEMDLAEWDRVIAVNLKGPFLCSRAVVPYMQKQSQGKIINTASSMFFVGHFDRPRYAHYTASKGGLIGLTRAMARELGEYNINVNAIAPGSTFSDEDRTDLERIKVKSERVPFRSIKRIEYPEDISGTVVFLASSDSDFITGQTIVIDGGAVMW
ncbi:MAG: 3-oxoacyl-ACP reductase FabG [Desulfobacteraceae bacterium]|nr:3-oxoacyl-ACP reductase FabG [Desulfobacteraceae bacterium]